MTTINQFTAKLATLVAIFAAFQAHQVNAEPTLDFTELTVPGGLSPNAFGINNSGAIVGISFDENGIATGLIDRKGTFTYLSLPASVSPFGPQLSGINDSGIAVGGYPDASGVWHSFIRPAHGEIIYPSEAIPSGSTPWTYMFHLNNRGIIVGFAGTGDIGTVTDWRPFSWKDGQYTLLDIPGALYGIALGINDHDEIVGWYNDGTGQQHGYVKRGDSYTSFDVPGAQWTNAFGINNRGQIVGAYLDSAGSLHGFRLSDGVFTTVDFREGSNNILWDINDKGQMVGTYSDANTSGTFLATIALSEH